MAKIKSFENDATEVVEAVLHNSAERLQQTQNQMLKAFETANAMAKANLEAVTAAATAATKGFEVLTKAVAGYTKESAAVTQETLAAIRGAKNAKDFLDLNQNRAKAHYDHFIAEASKMTELLVKVSGEIVEPLSNRYAVAVDQATRATH